ncbi:MAG TPA: hypothetical protein VHQ90_20475 [Thermoanaerobaculia bacterium]|nr:hypothetical protein [Thermoanaerobaculia bacterium]
MKRLLVLLALGLLLAGHVVYWYGPRERAEVPDPRGAPFRLLTAGAYDACVWIPYPHQNLGALGAAVADLPRVVAAASRLAGSASAAEPPSFGPFEVPPASEIVACSDLRGGRVKVIARIYPIIAAVARLAGAVAGNPWLGGGEAGRVSVAWSGRVWTVTAGEEEAPIAPDRSERAGSLPGTGPSAGQLFPASLAVVRWSGARPELPAGDYVLVRRGQGFEASLAGRGAPAASALDLGSSLMALAGPALLVVAGAAVPPAGSVPAGPTPGGPSSPDLDSRAPQGLEAPEASQTAAAGLPRPPAALALFEDSVGSLSTPFGELPGVAVFHPPGTNRWGLPTQGLGKLLAGRLPAAEAAGWNIVALDPGSLRRAAALAPDLSRLVSPAGAAAPPPAPGSLTLGLWLRPPSAQRIVSRVHRFLEKIPLVPRRTVQRWQDWETVLAPLAACDGAALAATAAPPSFALRIRHCAAP